MHPSQMRFILIQLCQNGKSSSSDITLAFCGIGFCCSFGSMVADKYLSPSFVVFVQAVNQYSVKSFVKPPFTDGGFCLYFCLSESVNGLIPPISTKILKDAPPSFFSFLMMIAFTSSLLSFILP